MAPLTPSPTALLAPTLAPWASDPSRSRGRLIAEPASPTRTPYQRDRDRIVHSTAFRRLAHKTQVFVPLEGDHFRTRLTHTIEVGQIARAFARGLRLDADLAEALALAHDLGHTPFGHTGEEALDALMAAYGGFDHNAQTLRIVTRLERRYAAWDGLNLTFETLEGLAKHNGPLTPPVPEPVLDVARDMGLALDAYATAEAQAAALADDVAYNAHDIDDGLRAGLFSVGALADAVPLAADLLRDIARRHGALDASRLIHELVRRVITLFVEDALAESARRLEGLRTPDEVRRAGRASVSFSADFAAADRAIKTFLFSAMYRHPDVARVREKAAQVVERLFRRFAAQPDLMPADWAARARAANAAATRVVCDYIAGMTDRYALAEFSRVFGEMVDLR